LSGVLDDELVMNLAAGENQDFQTLWMSHYRKLQGFLNIINQLLNDSFGFVIKSYWNCPGRRALDVLKRLICSQFPLCRNFRGGSIDWWPFQVIRSKVISGIVIWTSERHNWILVRNMKSEEYFGAGYLIKGYIILIRGVHLTSSVTSSFAAKVIVVSEQLRDVLFLAWSLLLVLL
jgi:hypothetical protein